MALSPRFFLRAGAAALAVLGVGLLVAQPGRRHSRAEAQFVVPEPLEVEAVLGAIRTQGREATASATANGWRVTVTPTSAGRARTVAIARLGLDTARQQVTAAESRDAQAARNDRAQVTEQIATLASRTGLADPEPAYREKVQAVADLKAQRVRAVSAGQPVGAIDAELAENQEAVFDLERVVARHSDLIDERTAAFAHRATRRAIDAARRAVRSTAVETSDIGGATGFGVAAGIAALVAAGLLVLVSTHVRGGAVAPVAAGAAAGDAQATETRYERFYRALAPPARDASEPDVDLVREEAREERGSRRPG